MQLHEQSIARELIPFLSFIQDQQVEGGNLFHAWRVAVVSVQLLPPGRESVRTSLFWAGLLHDIGMADFPEHVTQYAEDYQQKRTVQFREHPATGANMVAAITSTAQTEDS